MWVTGANASRITIQTPGTYAVSFLGFLTASATMTGVQTRLSLNGVANLVLASDSNVASSTAATFSASTQLQLAENDYVEAALNMTGGSAFVVNGSATDQNFAQTRIVVTWLGQAS